MKTEWGKVLIMEDDKFRCTKSTPTLFVLTLRMLLSDRWFPLLFQMDYFISSNSLCLNIETFYISLQA